jgi:hypothetical protein
LRQICNLIPEHEVSKIARETGVLDQSRTFSPWSHTVSLLDAQLTHCIGLNDLCDSLQLHCGPLSTVRGATAPSRNGLSHANRERSPEMAERLFWRTLDHDLLIGGEHFLLDIQVRLLQIRLAPHFIDRIRGAVQIQGDDGIADAFFAANPMCPDWSNLPNCRL